MKKTPPPKIDPSLKGTTKHELILERVLDYLKETGSSSVQEIAKATNVSTGPLHKGIVSFNCLLLERGSPYRLRESQGPKQNTVWTLRKKTA